MHILSKALLPIGRVSENYSSVSPHRTSHRLQSDTAPEFSGNIELSTRQRKFLNRFEALKSVADRREKNRESRSRRPVQFRAASTTVVTSIQSATRLTPRQERPEDGRLEKS